jgi:hypothetical protein
VRRRTGPVSFAQTTDRFARFLPFGQGRRRSSWFQEKGAWESRLKRFSRNRAGFCAHHDVRIRTCGRQTTHDEVPKREASFTSAFLMA